MQIAARALDEIENKRVNLATPLEELSRATGESRHFAVRMGDAVVVVARTGVPGALQLADRVGLMRPAHCLASFTDASAATVYRPRAELTIPRALVRNIGCAAPASAMTRASLTPRCGCIAVPGAISPDKSPAKRVPASR